MPKLFYVGVKAIIIQDGKVLLLKGNNRHCYLSEGNAAYWDLPGGRMEVGESIADALRRELSEEVPTAENIEVQNLVGACQPSRLAHPNERGLMLLLYRVNAHIPTVKISEEHSEFRWVGARELDSIGAEAHLGAEYREILAQVLK